MASSYLNTIAGLRLLPLVPTMAAPWPTEGLSCQHSTAVMPIDTFHTVSAADISIFAASAINTTGGLPPMSGGPSGIGGNDGAGGGRPVGSLFAGLSIPDEYDAMIRAIFRRIIDITAEALLIPEDQREIFRRQRARSIGRYLTIVRERHSAGESPLPPSKVVELVAESVLRKDTPPLERKKIEAKIAAVVYSISLHLAVARAAGKEIPPQADIDFPGYHTYEVRESVVTPSELEEMITSGLPDTKAGLEKLALVIGPGVDRTDIERALRSFDRVVVIEVEARQAEFIRTHYRDDPRVEVREGLIGRDADILRNVRADAVFASFSLGWERAALLGGALKRGAVIFFQDISANGQPTPAEDIAATIGSDFDVRFYHYGSPILTTHISPIYPTDVDTLLLKLKADSRLQFSEDMIDACLDGEPGILRYFETREEARTLAAIVHERKDDEQFFVVPHGNGFALYKTDIEGLSLHFAKLPEGASIEIESYERDGIYLYRIDRINEHVSVVTPIRDGRALTEDNIVYVTVREHASDPRSLLLTYPLPSEFLRRTLPIFDETDATSDQDGETVHLWPIRDAEGRITALGGFPLQATPGFNRMQGTFVIPVETFSLPSDHPASYRQGRPAGPLGKYDDLDAAIAAMEKGLRENPDGRYFVAPIPDDKFALFAKDVTAMVDIIDRRFAIGQSYTVYAPHDGSIRRIEITKINARVVTFAYSPLVGEGEIEREIVVFLWLRNRKSCRRERLNFAITAGTILRNIRDEEYRTASASLPSVADLRIERRTDQHGSSHPHAIVGTVNIGYFTGYEAIEGEGLEFTIPMRVVLGIDTASDNGSQGD